MAFVSSFNEVLGHVTAQSQLFNKIILTVESGNSVPFGPIQLFRLKRLVLLKVQICPGSNHTLQQELLSQPRGSSAAPSLQGSPGVRIGTFVYSAAAGFYFLDVQRTVLFFH